MPVRFFLIPEPQRGSCAVSALWGLLRLPSGCLRSAWESFSLFYLASRRAPFLQIGRIFKNSPVAKSFFLRFSLLEFPYIIRWVLAEIAILAWSSQKKFQLLSYFFLLVFPLS